MRRKIHAAHISGIGVGLVIGAAGTLLFSYLGFILLLAGLFAIFVGHSLDTMEFGNTETTEETTEDVAGDEDEVAANEESEDSET